MTVEARLDTDGIGALAPHDALSLARLRTPQRTWEGALVPAGTVGTIVEVLGAGKAYVLDFVEPYEAVATVDADELEDAERSEMQS